MLIPRCLLLIAFLAASSRAADPAVRIEKDVAYLPADRKEKGDLYLPADDASVHPGVLIIHGGGWTGGKRDATREINIGTTLAQHGYVCFSIDYLLDDKASSTICWPQNLYDCKTAVRWLRMNAARLHLDSNHIGVIGGSAGGHLASMVGVTGPNDGLDPSGPYADQSCRVQCVVDMYGPADVQHWKDVAALRQNRARAPELYRQFSVTTYLDKDDPPFLILHGTADKTVPLQQSEDLAKALTKAGIDNHLEIVPDAPHSFHLQPKQKDLRPLVLAFLGSHLGGSS